ncbi:GNAT family N-acetyltransferase [Sedimentibacter sp. zth1]|uniref:GNAT family N-acetyltransferase n=1 Tax=Sedimentibacter sp. zth1 TaxID=2816908 RepID=UPI001A931C45|nr:GNAT family N-acetyltransferase [Sedimentibacter sp. zth1]QSX05111.1 GNAT family N-acetyltransferase [Sedimentibacter sp. zth1]
MLDKSIQYYDVIMKRKMGTLIPSPYLPDGFRFAFFKLGDEKSWAEIETSVGEFKDVNYALKYFQDNYLPYLNELAQRCIFIENKEGVKVATITNWWNYTGFRQDPWVHWMATHPQYQSLGLGKAIVFKAMMNIKEIDGDKDVYLHTQTWSYKAINIYKKAGFNITSEHGLGGYENNNYEKALLILEKYIR